MAARPNIFVKLSEVYHPRADTRQVVDDYVRLRDRLEYLYGVVLAKSKHDKAAQHWLLQSIRLNPYHWGALSGYGMIYAEMDQPSRAVEYFEKALAVNPNLTSVQQAIETLKALLLQRRREMI